MDNHLRKTEYKRLLRKKNCRWDDHFFINKSEKEPHNHIFQRRFSSTPEGGNAMAWADGNDSCCTGL